MFQSLKIVQGMRLLMRNWQVSQDCLKAGTGGRLLW